jgi:hypothetical protein
MERLLWFRPKKKNSKDQTPVLAEKSANDMTLLKIVRRAQCHSIATAIRLPTTIEAQISLQFVPINTPTVYFRPITSLFSNREQIYSIGSRVANHALVPPLTLRTSVHF